MRSKTFLLTALVAVSWLAVSACTAVGQAQDTVKDAGEGHLGILAYGSLIDDPGDEIAAATSHRKKDDHAFLHRVRPLERDARGAPPWCRSLRAERPSMPCYWC